MLRPPQPRRIRCGSGAPSAAHGGARTTGRRAGALWAEGEAFWLWRTLLDDSHVEFPGVDDRLIGRRHGRFPPTARTPGAEPLSGEFDALRWYDTQGAAGSWHAGNLSVGEPVFAPGPGDPSEDHGYWTTYATDGTKPAAGLRGAGTGGGPGGTRTDPGASATGTARMPAADGGVTAHTVGSSADAGGLQDAAVCRSSFGQVSQRRDVG